MNTFLVHLFTVTLNLMNVWALDGSEVFGTQNEDCTPYLTHSNLLLPLNQSKVEDDSEYLQNNNTSEMECPPWYYRHPEKMNKCMAGKDFSYVLLFQFRTQQPYLQTLYCMTTSESNKERRGRRDTVGSCLLSFDNRLEGTFYPLPCNISKLNEYMCAGLNRYGQLCGKCIEGYAPPVFSYSLACVNCTNYHLNWLKYIGAAFGPLTIFCLLICFFHINAMSPYLFGFVFYCQIFSMPIFVRMAQNTNGFKEAKTGTRFGEKFYISLLSLWNLDILRGFYEPFCLHPHMTIVQALALDYLVALYPLVLLIIAYFLASLHGRNNKVILLLWRPFGSMLRPCVHNIDIHTSLIESFATLFFLSAMKIQSVSLDLLTPTPLYYPDGTTSKSLYLYLAGNIKYFGKHHSLYGVLAIFLLIIFTLLPGVLFFVYPCRCFQRFLNKINCNFISLKTFMDTFQGHYKDGTNNTINYRFFSGVFFLSRFVLMAIFFLLNSLYSVLIFGTTLALLGVAVAVLHPQRKRIHYVLDCIILMLLSVLFFTFTGFFLGTHNSIASQVSRYGGFGILLGPIVYITCLVFYWIIAKKRIPQRFFHFVMKNLCNTNCLHSNEEQQLLVES